MAHTNHRWRFFRQGGVDQVMLRDGPDLQHLESLDQKLWVALACPTRGLEIDQRTLELLDTDGDGRIRVPEILAALRWLREVHRDPGEILKGRDSIALSSINDDTETGAALVAGARRILESLGQPAATSIGLGDVVDVGRIFAAMALNGDGVVPPASAPTESLRRALEDIIACKGATPDRGATPGVDKAIADAFFAEAEQLCAWSAEGHASAEILPLGAGTGAAAAAVAAVRAKIDDYFTRCRLAAFDPRAAEALGTAAADLAALAGRDLSASSAEVARLPMARIEPGRSLPLGEGTNPAWTAALADLERLVVTPILGARTSLSEGDWRMLQERLDAHDGWLGLKPQGSVERLGVSRLRELLYQRPVILRLLQEDAAREAEFAQLTAVERLLRYQRDLGTLLNNFVNFSAFYGKRGAVFQAGTLYLDGRSCDLCVRVEDTARHAQLAALSRSYLAYCDCSRPSGEKMQIVAAFTGGDADHLMVGRNGVFYDRGGRDFDATIVKIIENPISIRQAFFSPYKSFVRAIEEQVAKRAAAADADAGARLKATAEEAVRADATKPAAEPKKLDVGTIAALGVAVAGVATFLSSILATFFGLGAWMPLGFLVLVLAISGPSMLIAWLKLRQRNLGPLLDAGGWAINGRVRINVPFGGALTGVASLPKGAERSLKDPYAEKRRPYGLYFGVLIALALAAAWSRGHLDSYLPKSARSVVILGAEGPRAGASGPAQQK